MINIGKTVIINCKAGNILCAAKRRLFTKGYTIGRQDVGAAGAEHFYNTVLQLVCTRFTCCGVDKVGIVNRDIGSQAFLDGRSLFLVDKITSCVSAQFREMEDDYGIIPLPKYDEAQETYYSHASAHADCFAIPVINEDFERCSIILEAMAAEGYKTIRPAVYDVAIKQKGARDEDSAKMIDLIYNGRTGDFADLYDEWGLVYTLDHMIGRQQSNTWASYYKTNESASVKRLGKAVEVFSSFE